MIDLLLAPFVVAMVILLTHAYFGLHIIQRGVIFVDLALAQIAALGGTAALAVGVPHGSAMHYVASFGFTLIGALIFSFSRLEESPVPQEALIGITYVLASAAVILLAGLSAEGAEHLRETMTGTLIWVRWSTIAYVAVSSAVIGLLHYVLRRPLLSITFAPEQVRSVRFWDFVFYATFGFIITASVNIAGVLMVFSVLVMPAVVAFLFTTSFRKALLIAWACGTAAIVVGLGVSFSLDIPTGPVLVLMFGAVLLAALALWPRYGVRVMAEEHRGLRVPAFTRSADQDRRAGALAE
jgi:zinc/manganese transport system permease protein